MLLLGWLATIIVSVAAFYEAELTRCGRAPAPSEVGNPYCDFVQNGGSYLLLLSPQVVALLGVLVAVAFRSRTALLVSMLLGLALAIASYVVAELS